MVFFSFTFFRMAFSMFFFCGFFFGFRFVGSFFGIWFGEVVVFEGFFFWFSVSFFGIVCLCFSGIFGFGFGRGGLTEVWLFYIEEGMLVIFWGFLFIDGDSGLCLFRFFGLFRGVGNILGRFGIVGVLIGIIGVLMGMGLVLMVFRRIEGLVEGVRRMVVIFGVIIVGSRVVGRLVVEVGRLVWNIRR